MSIDIEPEHLEIVQTILREHVPHCRVVVFGSRTRHAERQTSDLDLCIISDKRIDFEKLAYIRDAFSDSMLPYRVDVVDSSAISPEFKEQVIKEGVEIQSGVTMT